MRKSPITFNEASWLFMDNNEKPMHVATLLIYSLPDNSPPNYLSNLVNSLRDSTEFVDPFNKKLTRSLPWQMPIWTIDSDLDMEYHVRHLALPAPGGERELGMLIARLHSNRMDKRRPLWEYHVIEGLENNCFAVYFKMHHALVDGISGLRMLQRSMASSPDVLNTPALWSAVGTEKPANRLKGFMGIGNRIKRGLAALDSLVPAAVTLGKSLATSMNDDDTLILPYQSPTSILNKRILSQRRFATQVYDFARIRALSKAGECTINDIVLALCSGALRHFLKELCALPGESLTAGVPVSLRTSDDQGSGSAVGFMIANLGTNIADPIRRLEAIKASTRRSKESLKGMSRASIDAYTAMLMMPFAIQAATGLEGRSRPVFNVTISNVPGPAEPLYFRGAKLETMYPVSAVTHGQALNITCYSYAGTLSFGYAACRDTVPRIQRLAVYTQQALEELEGALLPGKSLPNLSTRKRVAAS